MLCLLDVSLFAGKMSTPWLSNWKYLREDTTKAFCWQIMKNFYWVTFVIPCNNFKRVNLKKVELIRLQDILTNFGSLKYCLKNMSIVHGFPNFFFKSTTLKWSKKKTMTSNNISLKTTIINSYNLFFALNHQLKKLQIMISWSLNFCNAPKGNLGIDRYFLYNKNNQLTF